MTRRLLALWALLAAGCGRGITDEQQGDLAMAQGRWADALDAYTRAAGPARVAAKRGDAALLADRPGSSALAWTAAARDDSTLRGEAAAGLARAAVAAQRAGDMLALSSAVLGLREVAPSWPVGRLALPLRLDAFPATEDVLALAPAVLAAAPGREVADAALGALAGAWRREGRCDRSVPIDDALSRRLDGEEAHQATLAVARCRLAQGLAATEADEFDSARVALGDAIDRDPDGVVGRRARVARGERRPQAVARFSARLARQTVAATRAEPDSITDLALDRLRAVAADSNREP